MQWLTCPIQFFVVPSSNFCCSSYKLSTFPAAGRGNCVNQNHTKSHINMNSVVYGELAVCIVACALACRAWTESGGVQSPSGALVVISRTIIALASLFGSFRYSDQPCFRTLHFFLRQLANVIPVVVTALTALKVIGISTMPAISVALIDSEASILFVAASLALCCFFTGEEALSKPLQTGSVIVLLTVVGSAYLAFGHNEVRIHYLAGALVIFIVRDALLRQMLPPPAAEPARRWTLAAALVLLSLALS